MIWMLFRLNIAGIAAETVNAIEGSVAKASARPFGLADLEKQKNQ